MVDHFDPSTPLVSEGADGVRRFLDARTQELAEAALKDLVPDKHGAFIVNGEALPGIKELSLTFVYRGPAGITVAIPAYKRWSGGASTWGGGFQIVKAF
jgi:hypothetical protein